MRALLTLFLLVFAVACAPAQKHLDTKETTDLRPTLVDYNMKLKWGMWEQASLYLLPTEREAFLGRHEALGEDFKIVSIEVKSVVFDVASAEVESEREWYDEGMVVKKERFVEVWTLDDNVWRRGESMTKKAWKKQRDALLKKVAEKPATEKPEVAGETNDEDMQQDLPEQGEE